MELRFTVLGKPQPAGSKKAFAIKRGGVPTGQVAVTDANAKSKPWQAMVKLAARDALNTGDHPMTWGTDQPVLDVGALTFSMTFYMKRPKNHLNAAGMVKPNAPALPTVRPDVTKLVRGVEDALTGTVWKDDAQVTDQSARKRYGEPERVEVVVSYCPPVGWRAAA
jgi:hypothetical protein